MILLSQDIGQVLYGSLQLKR